MASKNDEMIKDFCKNRKYKILKNGKVYSRIKGKWREIGFYINKDAKNKYRGILYKGKKLLIHRIVFYKFSGDLDPKLTINHIDGNGSNNRIENLEQVSQSANNFHRYRVLMHPPVVGNPKISQKIANKIRKEKRKGATNSELASRFDVHRTTIWRIINYNIWAPNRP